MLGAVVLLRSLVFAAEPKVIPLWPGVAPGSESWTYSEESVPSDSGIPNVRNVVHPTLTVYLPPPGTASGTGIVVCPGGGLVSLVMGKEGDAIARWLNSIGVAAFVLKYRLVRTGDEDARDPARIKARREVLYPLITADAQQALRLVRRHAAEWGVARDRIGIMGFSAGGYPVSGVAMRHDAETRPDFAVLVYGAVLHEELTVPVDAPPLFIAAASDDPKTPPADNSLRLYSAWNKAGIPAELHYYAHGGHGFALRNNGLPVNTWTDRFRDWLADWSQAKAGTPAAVQR